MHIPKETMKHISALSRLELSQIELEQFSGELEIIMNYVDILSQLPAENTEYIQPPTLLHNVFREDRAAESPDRAVLLANAPEADGETFTVPKIVD